MITLPRLRSLVFPAPDRVLDIVGAWTMGVAVAILVHDVIDREFGLWPELIYGYLGYTLLKKSRYALVWARIFSGLIWIAGLVRLVTLMRHPAVAARVVVSPVLGSARGPAPLGYASLVGSVLISGWTVANLMRPEVYAVTIPHKNPRDVPVPETQSV